LHPLFIDSAPAEVIARLICQAPKRKCKSKVSKALREIRSSGNIILEQIANGNKEMDQKPLCYQFSHCNQQYQLSLQNSEI